MSSTKKGTLQYECDSNVPPAPASGTRLRRGSGHDHHFLMRLARINRTQTELALSLYYDSPLVKVVLLSHVPDFKDRKKRVAISLDHPRKGPFIIVSCAGRFITCLASGMFPSRHPIITRKQLDATTAHVREIRARTNTAAKFNRE